jgi:hypothetical protein
MGDRSADTQGIGLVPYLPGDLVDVSDWNKTERPSERYTHPCVVTKAEQQQCQTGWMISFKDARGIPGRLDMGWLKPGG